MALRERALLGQISDVDLRLVRIFCAVVDCGGIATAELKLNIDISTVSRHIKDLETRLGLILCRRGRSGFALTPDGERVYAAAQQLLRAVDTFRTDVLDAGRTLEGTLHLALFEKTATNPHAHIDAALAQFQQMASAVTLHLHVSDITSIEQGVIDGQFHIGVIPEHRRSDRLAYHELFDETMLLYVGRDHPWFATAGCARDWGDLRTQRLAGLDYHSPNMEITRMHELTCSATASDQEGVAHLTLSGAFLGFLPAHYAAPFVREDRLRAVCPDGLRYECRYSAIHLKPLAPLRAAQVFLSCLLASRHGVSAG
jgi:DNA-binding transcriptional LysR family regulator